MFLPLGRVGLILGLRQSFEHFSRNLPVLVEIETVEKILEICRSFRAPVVSRSVPGPGLGNVGLLARFGKFCEQKFRVVAIS